MEKDKRLTVIKSFIEDQSILDTSMTLAELSKKLGDKQGELAGYTFAWDTYVYDVAKVDERVTSKLSSTVKAERLAKTTEVLNLNIQIGTLMQKARDRKLDEVAGYVYTEDKYSFIVGNEAEDLIKKLT